MDKQKKRKLLHLICVLAPMTAIFLIGIILLGVGSGISSHGLMIAGGIVASIGLIPLIIISAILWINSDFIK